MNREISEKMFVRLWFIEALSYSFSINLSMGFVTAFMIRFLGYTPLELGYLMTIRILAVALSQPFSALLVSSRRDIRKTLWLVGGGVNRIGWALIPLSLLLPQSSSIIYIGILMFIAQFLGGLAGVAAMDTIGDNVSPKSATEVFSRLGKYANIVVATSMITGMSILLISSEPLTSYLLIYSISLATAVFSTIYLYKIPDYNRGPRVNSNGFHVVDLKQVFYDSSLRKYLFIIALFNYGIHIPAPFWDYIVFSLSGGIDSFIPLKNLASLLTKALTIDLWKKRIYKAGLKRTLIEGMGLTSIIPIFYMEATHGLDIVLIEAVSGVVWAPVDVGTSIYNVYLPSRPIRPIYISVLNILVNTVATIGSASGTMIYLATGSVYNSLIASAILRAFTASLAMKTLPDINSKLG